MITRNCYRNHANRMVLKVDAVARGKGYEAGGIFLLATDRGMWVIVDSEALGAAWAQKVDGGKVASDIMGRVKNQPLTETVMAAEGFEKIPRKQAATLLEAAPPKLTAEIPQYEVKGLPNIPADYLVPHHRRAAFLKELPEDMQLCARFVLHKPESKRK